MAIGDAYDAAIERKEIFPLFVFSDPQKGANTGGDKFICFIGAYPPMDIFGTPEKQKEVIELMKSGAWKLRKLNEAKEKSIVPKMIGYGFGVTPSRAFLAAMRMSGHVKPDVVVQGT